MMGATLMAFSWFAPFSLVTMLVVGIIQWQLWQPRFTSYRMLRLVVSMLLPLSVLIVYKAGHRFENWVIPLGMSYYAFRQMHVAFEQYKGELRTISLEAYFEYLLFLPVLLIGPIHRIGEMQRSLRRQKWQPAFFSEGLERILYGLAKITFVGNYIFSYKVPLWANMLHSGPLHMYVRVIGFACNAYAQFSGFSDVAIGMGLLWGIKVMENFNYPFMATNMQEFWTRWHISLSSWCRDYIFHPIMALSRNRWLALVAAMLVLALWHEVSWRYVAWGAFHSLFILLAVFGRKAFPAIHGWFTGDALGRWVGRLLVFNLFAFSCLFLMADNFGELQNMIKQLFGYV